MPDPVEMREVQRAEVFEARRRCEDRDVARVFGDHCFGEAAVDRPFPFRDVGNTARRLQVEVERDVTQPQVEVADQGVGSRLLEEMGIIK